MRRPLYTAYARWFGARLDETELPLERYRSVGEFFTRRLRPDARSLDAGVDAVVSPCDGVLAVSGAAKSGSLVQAKGHSYTLAEFLVDESLAEVFDGGSYLTFYLSPRDYHRVHTPVAGRLVGYDYVPGTSFPVSPRFRTRVPKLFARNERIVLHLDTELGRVAVAMVAAAGVGNMSITAAGIESRHFRRSGTWQRKRFDPPVAVQRGDELGAFHLGSTVIVFFEPGAVRLEQTVLPGDGDASHAVPVAARVGQRVGTAVTSSRSLEVGVG